MNQSPVDSSRISFVYVAAAACAVGGMVFIAVATWLADERDPVPAGENEAMASEGVTAPSPRYSPDQVVQIQLEALKNPNRLLAVEGCYQFASPLNRSTTGPLTRFGQMLSLPPYDVMLRQSSTLIGKSVIRGERATVLATIVDVHRQMSVFRFFLTKQNSSPHQQCWMTDAVVLEAKYPTHGAAETAPPPTAVRIPPTADTAT